MKPTGWVGMLIVTAALVFGAYSFKSNIVPYVTFTAARQATDRQVQVMGALDKESIQSNTQDLTFTIISPQGERLPVRFVAARPANFAMATQVTAIGKYDGRIFQADNLLVKCPTKYQGTDSGNRSYSSGAGKAPALGGV